MCDFSNPILNLFEKGPEYVYSRNSEKFQIHDDFRLFITYNPFDTEIQKRLSPAFLNKCATFSLPPIDDTLNSSALLLSGLFRNLKDKKKNIFGHYQECAAKLANVHQIAKKKSFQMKELFAGRRIFSGRSLNFIYNSIFNSKKKDNYNQIIKSIIQNCYSYSYINLKELEIELIDTLKKNQKIN